MILQYMHWSECDISWGRADHPAVLPNPGSYPLVVDALFAGQKFSCKFSRVLVDGGSTINILYRDTLIKLGSPRRIWSAVRRLSMGLSLDCLAPPWGAFGWMSSLALKKISGESRFGLRSPISAFPLTHCWACPHLPSLCSTLI